MDEPRNVTSPESRSCRAVTEADGRPQLPALRLPARLPPDQPRGDAAVERDAAVEEREGEGSRYVIQLNRAAPHQHEVADAPRVHGRPVGKVDLPHRAIVEHHRRAVVQDLDHAESVAHARAADDDLLRDRKSTRLNSSHPSISYAVFCLKKKKKT